MARLVLISDAQIKLFHSCFTLVVKGNKVSRRVFHAVYYKFGNFCEKCQKTYL